MTAQTFERCRFGDRVSTCYHVPRCEHQEPGNWSSALGRWIEPKPGDQFEHAHLLNPKGGYEPAQCTVTAVRGGSVYFTYTADYQAGDHAGAWFFPLDKTGGHVRRWL